MSEDKCYYCGKAILKDESTTMKNVSLGLFSSERKLFHTECWRKYHGIRMKKDAIAYVALVDVAFLLFGSVLFLVLGTLGFITLALCIVILIALGVAYYRIKE